ncbi:uncharacterized protein LOC121392829 [Gigantopelta aegis]|uniref:uncharacterized protein LOC121392829 n=1 Tax=Gigantopelta aegis TaxID=1735272 RepID=UPI001B88C498|nr:uncharacterized protein LOC121392829 [Gigantopelta aegis]XP_041379838.1 uncharacterized protein LOC121392829 [Gigantopelta aegis]
MTTIRRDLSRREDSMILYPRSAACHLIPTRVICMLLVIIQGAVLNYYLVLYNNRYWFAWIAGDVGMLFVFLMTFVISYRHLSLVRRALMLGTPIETGSLPMGYFSWFVYSCMMSVRSAIIFKNFAWKLDEQDFFGPNTLKFNLCLSAIVFLMLLMSLHDAVSGSERKRHIDILTQTVVFDILDSVDILDIFFDKKGVDALFPGLDWAVVCIASLNMVLPTLSLMTLSRTHFGYLPLPKTLETAHKLAVLFLVNAPLLSIRLLLWHKLDQDVSTFIMKNIIVICLIIYDFYKRGEYRRSDLPELVVEKQSFELNMLETGDKN